MTYWYPGPFEVIRRVKARWPEVPVVLGGVYATLCVDHARARSGADAVLTGRGEMQALRWVNRVTGESPAGTLSPIDDVDDVMPAHDLRRPQGYVAIQTARGCPFHCPYCAVHQLSPAGFAPRAPERVVKEIAWCVESLGARDVAFYDDALLVNAAHHIPGTVEWQAAITAGWTTAGADPLLHNNSIYPCADPRAWEEVKQQMREGNHALLARLEM